MADVNIQIENDEPDITINKDQNKQKIHDTPLPTSTKLGTSWTGCNIESLLNIIVIASYQVDALEMGIDIFRSTVRRNTIVNMIFSTASGSLSVTNFGMLSDKATLQTVFNIIFLVFSFIVAISAGRLKIYQIQERLETFIKLKQQWTAFLTSISTEFQLPVHQRKDALHLLHINKEKFMNLLNMDCELPYVVKHNIKQKILESKNQNFHDVLKKHSGLALSDITFDIAKSEGVMLASAQNNPEYHHNQSINRIYDNICSNYIDEIVSHRVDTPSVMSRSLSIGSRISTRLIQPIKELVKI